MTSTLRDVARTAYTKALGVEPVWRYAMNAGPTRDFQRSKPALQSEAQRVLADLNRDGVAKTTLADLTGDATLLERLQTEAARLEAFKADELAERKAKLESGDVLEGTFNKLFVMTLLDPDRPVVSPDDLLVKLMLHSQMKGIADSYYGMRTRVADVNIWRNLPSSHGPVSSQLWHRDLPEDHMILKTFVYLEDVTEGAGPFSYLKGTHGKGRRDWKPANTQHDGHNVRATEEAMNAETTEDQRPSFAGPAGTVLFADTFGWHKGGQATTDSRFLIQGLWSSKAALPDRMLKAPEGFDIKNAPFDLAYAKN